MVVWLARGLATLGHRVSLLAGPGSSVPEATLIPVDPNVAAHADFNVGPYLPPGVDIVHAHRPLRAHGDIPLVWTLHGLAKPGEILPPNLICLSARHAARHGTTAFVYNGIDPADYIFREQKGDFDLFLGRLHSSKGYHWAIEGARRTGHRLIVAGGWRPSLRRDVKFVGQVAGKEKAELLADARCLWMPALWEEPFGLTLVEALMSGTPVLGTRQGALPEIITPQVGALGNDLEELIVERGRLDHLSAAACRDHAVRHFSHQVMAAEYLRYYQSCITSGTLPAGRRLGA